MTDNYPIFKKKLDQASLLYRSFAFAIFEDSQFNKDELTSDISPYKFIRYREKKDSYCDMYFDRSLRLLEMKTTHEIFKLSLNDLMSMDYDTFVNIENKIEKMEEAHRKALQELNKERDVLKGNKQYERN